MRTDAIEQAPTALLSAAGLIAGFGVADATGSRPLGGVVLAGFGVSCIYVWLRRDGPRTAVRLTAAGLIAFAVSHLLGHLIGAWPAVLLVSGGVSWASWRESDSRGGSVLAGTRRRRRLS